MVPFNLSLAAPSTATATGYQTGGNTAVQVGGPGDIFSKLPASFWGTPITNGGTSVAGRVGLNTSSGAILLILGLALAVYALRRK